MTEIPENIRSKARKDRGRASKVVGVRIKAEALPAVERRVQELQLANSAEYVRILISRDLEGVNV